jgi:uncharacterized membrane protein (Fun14 family)
MILLITDALTSISATVRGGFFGGILLGYTMKKVFKLIVVVIGLFIAVNKVIFVKLHRPINTYILITAVKLQQLRESESGSESTTATSK